MPVKGRKTLENSLYMEWFTDHQDMVLMESAAYSVRVSLPEWTMDACEEQVQIMANQQMLRTQVKTWARNYANNREDGNLPGPMRGTGGCGRRKPLPSPTRKSSRNTG